MRVYVGQTRSRALVVGDEVEWESQSAGYRRTKRGTVIRVQPPGTRPDRLSANRFPGMARDHESYVVRANGKTYWPRVNQLRRAATKEHGNG